MTNVEIDSANASSNSLPLSEVPFNFPETFVWGAATSSYQIEGAHDVDGRVPSIWDTFSHTDGKIKDGSSGDEACDHYNRFKDDIAIMKDLGLHAYRFSIAWPRIISDLDGTINAVGLDFYDQLVDELLANGITPLPTLYHWDLPQYLDDVGGWLNRDTAYHFATYAEAVVARLGNRIETWTTLNEPFVSSYLGYVNGEHAPGHRSIHKGFTASHHLMLAHGLAGEHIRAAAPDARLAIVLNFTQMDPASNSEADRLAMFHAAQLQNFWYADVLTGRGYPKETADFYDWDRSEVQDGDLDIISKPIDLLGVNFYSRASVSASPREEPDIPRNTMGWEIHPPSLGKILRWLHERYEFPAMMITENGGPFPDDRHEDGRIADIDRINYLSSHLAEVQSAAEDGVPMEGYLVWSLFDNFEWAYGYGPTFGIVQVDYDTQVRTPKKSALWFRDAIKANSFSANVVDGVAYAEEIQEDLWRR